MRDETFQSHAMQTFDQDDHAGSKMGKQGCRYGRLPMGPMVSAFPEIFRSEPCAVASRDAAPRPPPAAPPLVRPQRRNNAVSAPRSARIA